MSEPENPSYDAASKLLDDLVDGFTWDWPNTLTDINEALDKQWKYTIDEDFLGIEDIDNEVGFWPMASAYDLKTKIHQQLEQSKHGDDFKQLRRDWSDWVVDAIYQRWLLKKTARTEKYYKWEIDEKRQKKPE
jgi:hypothetical protein